MFTAISISLPQTLKDRISQRAAFRRVGVSTEIVDAVLEYYKLLDIAHEYWRKRLTQTEIAFLLECIENSATILTSSTLHVTIEESLWDDTTKQYSSDREYWRHLLEEIRYSDGIKRQGLCDLLMAKSRIAKGE